jgi:predicted amidohydrolase YtcJ
MNPSNPHVQAIAVKGDEIMKVGSNDDITPLIDKNTKVIQLDGKTVIPGIIDTHIHVTDFGRLLLWLDLTGCKSITDIKNILRKKINATSAGKWILGRGLNEALSEANQFPTRFDLDLVAPNNPVILYHQSKKLCVANTKTLELARITKKTTILSKEGIIEKDPDTGNPTGIIEGKAVDLIWKVIPEPNTDDLLKLTHLALSKIIEAGITSIHWMILSPLEFSIIRKLDRKTFPLRIYLIVPFELWKKELKFRVSSSWQEDSIKIGAIELSADGYLASKTAALFQPYADSSKSNGKLLYTQKTLNFSAVKIIQSGYQLIIHAMGDKAVEAALTTIEYFDKKIYDVTSRIRIEQAALINKNFLEKMKNQKILVSVQPCVINSEFKTWAAIEKLGQRRARWLFPLKKMIDNNITVLGGSDCPMEPLNPFIGIQMLVDRKFFPEEAITSTEALEIYTINAAYSTKEENCKGSIKEGKLADLTILSNDLTSISSSKIGSINVTNTIIGGKIVYSK